MILAMVVFCLFSTGGQVAAEPQPEHLVTLNTRTFDLGVIVAEMRRTPDFIPMMDVDWLREILWADPDFGPATVFHIDMTHPSNGTAKHLWTFDPDWESYFVYTDNVPKKLQVPGMDVRSHTVDWTGDFKMVPMDPDAGFSVECGRNRSTQEPTVCVILASYPPDPLIYLKTRDYNQIMPWEDRFRRFDDIAAKMREIALCLDVTDREIEFDATGKRKLADCKVGAGM